MPGFSLHFLDFRVFFKCNRTGTLSILLSSADPFIQFHFCCFTLGDTVCVERLLRGRQLSLLESFVLVGTFGLGDEAEKYIIPIHVLTKVEVLCVSVCVCLGEREREK